MTPRLNLEEARAVAEQFGVALEQVRRDHLISVVLAALSKSHADDLVFFGGTALARTHLPDSRLSEDIDLLALGARQQVADDLMQTIGRSLRASHGRVRWEPPLDAVRDVEAGVLVTDDNLAVRVQLLRADAYPPWPTELREVQQRYADVDRATLLVPTIEAFAAWKTVAWFERRASRDLFDLCALARRGAMTETAAALYERLGPTGNRPHAAMFGGLPADDWVTALAAQTRLDIDPSEALVVVRDAWQRASPTTAGV